MKFVLKLSIDKLESNFPLFPYCLFHVRHGGGEGGFYCYDIFVAYYYLYYSIHIMANESMYIHECIYEIKLCWNTKGKN